MGSNQLLEVSPADYHTRLKFNKDDIFHPDSYLSKSVLWGTHGISLWAWRNLKPFKPTAAMTWGSVIDCMVTTPDEVDDLIVIKDDCPHLSASGSFASKLAKEWRDEHLAADRLIISQDDYDRAMQHADVVLNQHPVSSKIFANSKKQVILHCKNEDGINLKGLADLVPDGDFLCDFKTTADFSLDGFSKTIAKFGYGVQAGLYLIMFNMMFPDTPRKRFKFIWQDSKTGEVAVTEASAEDLLAGQAMVRFLLKRLIKAYKDDDFPMLTGNLTPVISRPMWSQMADEVLLTGSTQQL